jgi:hypothetical protein
MSRGPGRDTTGEMSRFWPYELCEREASLMDSQVHGELPSRVKPDNLGTAKKMTGWIKHFVLNHEGRLRTEGATPHEEL